MRVNIDKYLYNERNIDEFFRKEAQYTAANQNQRKDRTRLTLKGKQKNRKERSSFQERKLIHFHLSGCCILTIN